MRSATRVALVLKAAAMASGLHASLPLAASTTGALRHTPIRMIALRPTSSLVERALADFEEATLEGLPEMEVATDLLETCGVESTTRLLGSLDQGCEWMETADTVTVRLQLAGLRGQPAGALAVHLASSRDAERRGMGTAAVVAFGQVVWSCVLRGAIVVDACSAHAEDGEHMLPVLCVTVKKLRQAPRWGGFIDEIEFNTLM